ncbi:MAG: twin-arginine translocase TatA/TatE family subunit [Planctomycetota bacterium]
MTLLPLGFGMPGLPEMIIVLVIMLVLFGNRLPSVMRSLGSGITEFKKGIKEGEAEASQITSEEE